MRGETTTRWTCDRCGLIQIEDLNKRAGIPSGWRYVIDPQLTNRAEPYAGWREFCGDCSTAMREWMKPINTTSPEASA